MREYVHRQISNLFARSLTFSNFVLVFCLVHDQVYIHDEICAYAAVKFLHRPILHYAFSF